MNYKQWSCFLLPSYLRACCGVRIVIECLIICSSYAEIVLPLSYGVFEDYYSREIRFKYEPNFPIVGTLSTCTLYLGSPVTCILINKFPEHKRQMVWAGWLIRIISLVGASFARTVVTLMMSQSNAYSIGVILYIPVIEFVHDWAVGKRELALWCHDLLHRHHRSYLPLRPPDPVKSLWCPHCFACCCCFNFCRHWTFPASRSWLF